MPSETARPVPALLASTAELAAAGGPGGARWRLDPTRRQLDANLVRLAPGERVEPHTEPLLDVLLHVVAGGGTLEGEDGAIALTPGALVWLPRGARRGIAAGPAGLVHLTVHGRRPGLAIGARAQGGEAACQLHRVCRDCGRLAQESDARYCARCGERLPAADGA
ncbi:hypothetical protein [Streptomyces sp. NPDC050560]|uniref:hypothetical protein n=1 Tax=Streptomyces sp. NPDC050560 TaxID=3365630 RepID=UPI00378CA75F